MAYNTNITAKISVDDMVLIDEVCIGRQISRSRFVQDALSKELRGVHSQEKEIIEAAREFLIVYRKTKSGKKSERTRGVLNHFENQLAVLLGFQPVVNSESERVE